VSVYTTVSKDVFAVALRLVNFQVDSKRVRKVRYRSICNLWSEDEKERKLLLSPTHWLYQKFVSGENITFEMLVPYAAWAVCVENRECDLWSPSLWSDRVFSWGLFLFDLEEERNAGRKVVEDFIKFLGNPGTDFCRSFETGKHPLYDGFLLDHWNRLSLAMNSVDPKSCGSDIPAERSAFFFSVMAEKIESVYYEWPQERRQWLREKLVELSFQAHRMMAEGMKAMVEANLDIGKVVGVTTDNPDMD